MTTTTVQTQTTTEPRLAIKKEHLAGLDPEWVELWHTHGADMVRADEVSLEEYRKNPVQYSFTYPTCAGESYDSNRWTTCSPSTGPDVFHVEDVQVPVTTPVGEMTVRVYSPEGPGPFPVHLNFHGGRL
jgi:acetyl esterase/lipase